MNKIVNYNVGKGFIEQITKTNKKETQVTDKLLEKCSASLAIREM